MQVSQVLPGHSAAVQAVASAPQGDELATASFDGSVKLWNLNFESVPRLKSTVFAPRPFAMGTLLATSAELTYAAMPVGSNQVTVFNVDSGRQVATLQTSGTWALTFCRENEAVLCGLTAADGKVWKWNWKQDTVETVASVPLRGASYAQFSPDGRHLITFFADTGPTVRDLESGDVWWTLSSANHGWHPDGVDFSPSGKTCWIRGSYQPGNGPIEGFGQLLDMRAKRPLADPGAGIAIITDRLVAIHGPPNTHTVTIRDRIEQGDVCKFTQPAGSSLAGFSPDGLSIAGIAADGRVLRWHLPTGQLISQMRTDAARFQAMRYSVDGRRLCVFTARDTKAENDFLYSDVRLFLWTGTDEP
jgi:WD40 repeat protein